MKMTRQRRRVGRSRLRAILLLVGGAALLSAIVVGMWRRSRRTVPTQPVPFSEMELRSRILKDLPLTERRLDLAGVSTPVLEGGEGPPIVLLHGQAGFAEMWGWVIPHLVGSHRVVVPDLPGLGRSEVRADGLDAPRVVAWLDDLIAQTCAEPPTLVGISLGGPLRPTSPSSTATGSAGSSWLIRARSAPSGRHPAFFSRSSGT